MKEFYNSNKKVLNIVFIIVGIVFVVYLAWTFYFSKQVIFNKEEQALQEAGKKYFEMYANKMPSSENEVSTVSAKDLYDKKFVESKDLYIPKTKKGCSLEASWVKARKENGKIEYYTYLKCGKYESKTDHEGPEIILNGEKEITLDINEKYEEKGIKSVVDKEDGTIDKNKVTIKNNEIDSSKVGTYEVSYTVYDSLKNKTTEKRIVKVVKKLEGIIKEATNNKNYYSGENVNNYVQFSGMLWRIVKLNEDGTVKIVSNGPVANIIYGNEKEYKKSNIYTWLNEYFYNHIESKGYIVKNDWCIQETSDANNINDKCKEEVKSYVGLLTINEYKDAQYLQSYLPTSYLSLTTSEDKNKIGYVYQFIDQRNNPITTWENDRYTQILPVINIKKGLFVQDGDGSYENPYHLGDYQIGKPNTSISKRISGEYVDYSNYLWRISEIDKEGNATLIMQGTVSSPNFSTLEIGYTSGNLIYNIKEKGNLGYKIENEISNYINDNKLIKNSWDIPTLDANKNFKDYKKNTFKSKFSIPASYDLFSATGGIKSWLIDNDKNQKNVHILSPFGLAYSINESENPTFATNGIKLKVKMRGNTKISSGRGTATSPYVVK